MENMEMTMKKMNDSGYVKPKKPIPWASYLGSALLIAGSLIMLLPLVWLFTTAFKSPSELSVFPPTLLPQKPTVQNFINAFSSAPFNKYFFNSLGMATISTVGILLTSSLAGYVFAKFKFKGLSLLFSLIVATAIIPFEIYMTPLYMQMNSLGLINTFTGMVFPNMIMSFGIFFMRQTIVQQIPDELMEAARVEGAGEWKIFFSVVVPLLRSTMGALGIFAFLEGWNAFVWPLLIVNNQSLYTMELGLAMFQSTFTTDISLVSSGSLVSVIPILIVYLVLRKQIMQSIAATGLK